jgi:MoaA/NifB/PqqE/SkfB family radical SAM enzyme
MSVTADVVKALAVRPLSRCLTGRPGDLRRLLFLERIPYPSPVLRAFLKRLARDLDAGGGGMANILLHLGRHANPLARRRLIENLIFNWGVKGASIRTRIRDGGRWVPFLVAVSPWMKCNLRCTGCYSGLYDKNGELSEAELDDVLSQCREMGNYFIVLSGGEPFVRQRVLLRLFRKYRDMYFLVFTNGTLLDEALVAQLAALGNVAPAISVEGFEAETDERRGAGVFQKLSRAMERLERSGVVFGISATCTSRNLDAITSERFVEYYLERGALFGWYFQFMPVGKDPLLQLVPSPEQRLECGRRVAALRKRYPMFLADFWNDGPAVGGCMAGARRYLHIVNSGRVEMCVFAHFGVDNIRETSILDAANSPFFRAIRDAFPYSESANLKRPCPIIDNPEVLRTLVNEHMARAGHEHAEDFVRDPGLMQWVDGYAARMKELTEPDWLEMIDDPESRWFKEKYEYRNLFVLGRSRSAS